MKIGNSDQLGLFALSSGKCYYPDCEVPIVRFVDGKPALNAGIAHIASATPSAPRFSAAVSRADLNSFSNLILLCPAHHAAVDHLSSTRYTADLLHAWKKEREAPLTWAPQERLLNPEPSRGIREEAERHLQDLISETYYALGSKIDDALTDFERHNAEAADALRALMRSFPDRRFY